MTHQERVKKWGSVMPRKGDLISECGVITPCRFYLSGDKGRDQYSAKNSVQPVPISEESLSLLTGSEAEYHIVNVPGYGHISADGINDVWAYYDGSYDNADDGSIPIPIKFIHELQVLYELFSGGDKLNFSLPREAL